jgi:hypothetical protein
MVLSAYIFNMYEYNTTVVQTVVFEPGMLACWLPVKGAEDVERELTIITTFSFCAYKDGLFNDGIHLYSLYLIVSTLE